MDTLWAAYDWLRDLALDTLILLGLLHRPTILFLGLDNSGKTTLTYMLRESRIALQPPTTYDARQELTLGGRRMQVTEPSWRSRRALQAHIAAADGIVFMIDAADRHRFHEAQAELELTLRHDVDRQTPILILGNKIDRPESVASEELHGIFKLEGRTTGKEPQEGLNRRPMELFMCSVVKRVGYGPGLRWLAQHIK